MAKISGSDIRPGMVIEYCGSRAAQPSAAAPLPRSVERPPFIATGKKAVVSTDEIAYVGPAE